MTDVGSGGTRPAQPWLVVVDMQVIFAEPSSHWFAVGFAGVLPVVQRLVQAFGDRVVFTRFVAPEEPRGAWASYYEQWPFALVAPDDPWYDLVPGLGVEGHRVLSRTTFGKWDEELADIVGPDGTIALVGTATDCCVLSTALAAADAGVTVNVVSDACAGGTDLAHQRALEAMALYDPMVQITTSADLLG